MERKKSKKSKSKNKEKPEVITILDGNDRVPLSVDMEVRVGVRKVKEPVGIGAPRTKLDFKPMLACNTPEDLTQLPFPLIGSPKMDGIRCCIIDGQAYTRSLKPIRNEYISRVLSDRRLNNIDGQIIVTDQMFNGKDFSVNFQRTTSAVMSYESDDEVNFKFLVFDYFGNPDVEYIKRLDYLNKLVNTYNSQPRSRHIYMLEHRLLHDIQSLKNFEEGVLSAGGEGLMLRTLNGGYKYGRCTPKHPYLMKLKRFDDTECQVIGFIEQETNYNPKFITELGRTKRSSSKQFKMGAGTLGALMLRHDQFGYFNVGTGFDDLMKKQIWDNRQKYLGKLAKIKYQTCGMKDKPRIPVFIGFRDKEDM